MMVRVPDAAAEASRSLSWMRFPPGLSKSMLKLKDSARESRSTRLLKAYSTSSRAGEWVPAATLVSGVGGAVGAEGCDPPQAAIAAKPPAARTIHLL
jgi:hypothetical protein